MGKLFKLQDEENIWIHKIHSQMRKLVIVLIICAQIGCSPNKNKTPDNTDFLIKPLIVLNDKDDGWGGDIRLSVVDISENDTSKIYKAVSRSNNEDFGLLIYVTKKRINSQGFGDAITLRTIGKESDNLLHKLSELYKQRIAPGSKFADQVSASFVDLTIFAKSVTGSTGNTNPNIKQYKLFFETKDDEGELFLNINSADKWLELSEKDPEYRPVVLQALTK